MSNTVQISASIDKSLHKKIAERAKKENRSFSKMVETLLKLTVK